MACSEDNRIARKTIIEGRGIHIHYLSTLDTIANNYKRDFHSHDEAQLLLVIRGLVTFDVNNKRWMVPPQNGIWIPANIAHSMSSTGEVELHCVYLDPGQTDIESAACCIFGVDPLLRELIIKMSMLPGRIDTKGSHARLVMAMLDQFGEAPKGKMQIPLPSNPGLREIAENIVANPSDRATVSEWAKKIGMSERTLQRALLKEAGMSFGRWRRQLHILLALQRFSEGDAVNTVAYFLGYDSPSAFIEMFRKVLGRTPVKFLSENVDYTALQN